VSHDKSTASGSKQHITFSDSKPTGSVSGSKAEGSRRNGKSVRSHRSGKVSERTKLTKATITGLDKALPLCTYSRQELIRIRDVPLQQLGRREEWRVRQLLGKYHDRVWAPTPQIEDALGTVLQNAASIILVLYCTVLYCTVLYCTVLYCTVLYCTVLYYAVLCCTL
jgi:hypothetical protein